MRETPLTGGRRFPLFLLLAGLVAASAAQAAGTASGGAAPATGSAATGGSKAAGPATTGGGEQLLKSAQPPCITCHQMKAGVDQPGPSLAGLAQRAQKRIKEPGYKGKAKDAKSYIRESIVDPNAYVVPGPTYGSGGKSLMPATYGQTLKPAEVDQLVDFLMKSK